ncbi:hypothetical protein Glove_856g45 [Diversispora epigaea]|uniref:Protein kinase domain-containing protein n=1 Tax=Diversispora epigaea TaxID=1348612 RepID=A0A397G4J2_9GLOM|nr:hypothetical protein Glove_856g45 [Diversispora epigaea]
MATQKIEWNAKLLRVWGIAYYSLDPNIHKTIAEKEKYRKNIIKNNSCLTKNEKKFLIHEFQDIYDVLRIGDDSVEKQKCSNCLNWHQAIQYCELCIRKYLKNNFGNWTSGNNEIDKLIQECQQKTVAPHKIIEWIEYDQFEDRQTLERFGRQKIVLKRLNNSKSNNVNWFQEVTLSFTLNKTSVFLAKFYGLTKDPTTQDYMLVMRYYQNDLRHFLKDNCQSLSLLQKYNIIYLIAFNLNNFNRQNIVHRDLHSGNILYNSRNTIWSISDLGLSGPVNKPSNSIYGNLPYIAPEVICSEIYTTKSDIYSMGILMWEVITSETPFDDYEHDLELALDIVKGCRPKIYEYIPHEYATLMKQCWDANPDNRPDAYTICIKMRLLLISFCKEMKKRQEIIQSKNLKSIIKNFFNFFKLKTKKDKNNQVIMNTQLSHNTRNKKYRIQNSKVHTFNIPIQPRNATDEYDSGQSGFEISEEMQQQYLKIIGADNLNKSCDDQENGIAGPSQC